MSKISHKYEYVQNDSVCSRFSTANGCDLQWRLWAGKPHEETFFGNECLPFTIKLKSLHIYCLCQLHCKQNAFKNVLFGNHITVQRISKRTVFLNFYKCLIYTFPVSQAHINPLASLRPFVTSSLSTVEMVFSSLLQGRNGTNIE